MGKINHPREINENRRGVGKTMTQTKLSREWIDAHRPIIEEHNSPYIFDNSSKITWILVNGKYLCTREIEEMEKRLKKLETEEHGENIRNRRFTI